MKKSLVFSNDLSLGWGQSKELRLNPLPVILTKDTTDSQSALVFLPGFVASLKVVYHYYSMNIPILAIY